MRENWQKYTIFLIKVRIREERDASLWILDEFLKKVREKSRFLNLKLRNDGEFND